MHQGHISPDNSSPTEGERAGLSSLEVMVETSQWNSDNDPAFTGLQNTLDRSAVVLIFVQSPLSRSAFLFLAS